MIRIVTIMNMIMMKVSGIVMIQVRHTPGSFTGEEVILLHAP